MGVASVVEHVEQPFSGVRVDREKGVISGVKLCGFTSKHGRDYPPDVFRRDYAKYEGAVVNFDHHLKGVAPVSAVAGRIRNPRVDADGTPRGDLHLLTSHPQTAAVLEAAEKDPGLFGLSHRADCGIAPRKGGREVVESIKRVQSVDIVSTPATTSGFFESAGVPLTLKQFAEAFARLPKSTVAQIEKVKALAEMDGLGDAPVLSDAPTEATDPDQAIADGHKSAIMALVEKAMSGDLDPKEALSKIKTVLNSHASVSDKGDDKGGDDSGDDKGGDDVKKESKAPDVIGVLTECVAEGYSPGPAELKALSLLPTADDRKAYIAEQRAKVPAAQPQSAARKPGGGSVAKVAEQAPEKPVPTDGKTFAESIRVK